MDASFPPQRAAEGGRKYSRRARARSGTRRASRRVAPAAYCAPSSRAVLPGSGPRVAGFCRGPGPAAARRSCAPPACSRAWRSACCIKWGGGKGCGARRVRRDHERRRCLLGLVQLPGAERRRPCSHAPRREQGVRVKLQARWVRGAVGRAGRGWHLLRRRFRVRPV